MAYLRPFVFLLAIAAVGCTEQLTGVSTPEATPSIETEKVRNGHLFDVATTAAGTAWGKGKKPGTGDDPIVDPVDPILDPDPTPEPDPGSGDLVGLVFGLDTQAILERFGVMERYAIFERYALVERYGILERFSYEHVFDGYAIWMNASELDDLLATMLADPDIAWVEPDIYLNRTPLALAVKSSTGTEYTPWGTAHIGAIGYRADGVDLFVVDTGVSNVDVPLTTALDFREGAQADPSDVDGHGTHVAALAAAEQNGTGLVGVAPGASVHSLKVLAGNETSTKDELEMAAAIAAIEHAVAQKILNPNRPMVLNFSLGADVGTKSYTALDHAVAAASLNGVTVVVSAGNDGMDASTYTPAHTAEAITVGAYDLSGQYAGFSNFGASIDILAPGEYLPSLAPGSTDLTLLSGTSQAAALVSGAAALFLAENPNATPSQVEAALKASGRAEVTRTPLGTINARVDVPALMDRSLPPFFNYAIASDDILEISGGLTVTSASASVNANVFTNGALNVYTRQAVVKGFGYHGTTTAGKTGMTFQPAYNPGSSSATQKQPSITIPAFNAADYQHLATRTTNGDIRLDGHYDLGTKEAPVVWYIDGNLGTNRDVSFSGYGVLLVTGETTFNHSVVTDITAESRFAVYGTGNIYLYRQGSQLSAQLFSDKEVVIGQRSITVYGSITAGERFRISANDTKIVHQPVSPALTSIFWP